MTLALARLLAAALVFCCLPALAQDQQSQSSLLSPSPITVYSRKCHCGGASPFSLKLNSSATPTEPWRIIPNQTASFDSVQNALDPARLDQYRLDQINGDPSLRHLKLDALDADTTCYTIRSYVVARDSKDSDSTHPAGYSTCQPAARYGLKTTEIRSGSQDR